MTEDNEEIEYDEEEALNYALACQKQAEEKARSEGKSEKEVAEIGQMAFKQAQGRHALEFLKKIKERLDRLSNQNIARLLMLLIQSGLAVESEEELEFYILQMEHLSMQRLAGYFSTRQRFSKKNKLKFFLRMVSGKEFEALVSMATVLEKRITPDKNFKWKNNSFFKKIVQKLNKDLEQKRKNKKAEIKEQKNDTTDYFSALKDKMLSAGVKEGGNYWNSVVSSFNTSIDKAGFVKNWSANQDTVAAEKIAELRGTDNNSQTQEKPSDSRVEQQKESQEEVTKAQIKPDNNNSNVKKEEKDNSLKENEKQTAQAQQLISEEFSNARNQKKAAEAAKELNRSLTKDDVKVMKIKAVGGRN